jgi:hypothetical protein
MSIPVNTSQNITSVIRNLSDQVVDPTALTFTITPPTGSPTTYTYGVDSQLVRTSVGQFYVEWLFNQSGKWTWVWNATLPTPGGTATTNGGIQVTPLPETCTVHFEDGSSNPVAGVNVQVYANEYTIVAGGYTDSSGNLVVQLFPGAYVVEATMAKTGFSNPYSMTVVDSNSPQSFTFACTPLGITAPAQVRKVRLFGYIVGADGTPSEDVRVTVETVAYGGVRPWVASASPGTGVDPIDVMVRPEKRDLLTDSTGYWEADVVPDSLVRVEILDVRFARIFRVPNDARITTLNIKDARQDPGTAQGLGIDSDVGSRGVIGGES